MKMINFNFSLNIIFIIGVVLKFVKNEKEINLNNEQMYSINYIDKIFKIVKQIFINLF